MRLELILLAGLAMPGVAQVVLEGPSADVVLLGQVAPPAPPPPPMQDVIRLMAGSGSYLGVGVRDVDAERKKALGLKEERGAEVTSVADDSPASRAGLKAGDVVLEYGNQRVEGMEQFIRMVRETPAGREVKLSVMRAGSMVSLAAKPDSGRKENSLRVVRAIPAAPAMAWTPDTPRSLMFWRSGTLGVEAESLDNQLADFFGVKEGVLVRSVGKGTAAEKAGLRAGDVIVKVDEAKVSSPREVTTAMRGAKNKTVNLGIVREKKESSVKVTVDEEPPAPPRARAIQNKLFE